MTPNTPKAHVHLIYSTWTQNLATLASAVPKIWLRTSKLKMSRVTLTTPLLGWFAIRQIGHDIVYQCTEYDDSHLAIPEVSLGLQNLKWSRDFNHAHFVIHLLGLDIAYVCSKSDHLSHSRYMVIAHQNLNVSRDLNAPFRNGLSPSCYDQTIYQI